jgi:hypothetical protein
MFVSNHERHERHERHENVASQGLERNYGNLKGNNTQFIFRAFRVFRGLRK